MVSHSNTKMNYNGILETFWPFMKVLQLLGACPIQKDGDSPCGFKAFTFLAYLTRVLLAWILGIGIFIGVFAYLCNVYGITVTELNKLFFNFAELSEMDLGLMAALSFSMTSVGILVLIGNFTLKNQFIELMQLFASLKIPQHTHGRKYLLLSVILVWLLTTFGLAFTSIFNDSIDLKSALLLAIALLSLNIIQSSQIIGFLIFYSEACNQLNDWINCLIQKFESKQHYEFEIIEEFSTLLKVGLKKTNAIFSRFLFWISTLYLTALIVTAYLSMTFLSLAYEGKMGASGKYKRTLRYEILLPLSKYS